MCSYLIQRLLQRQSLYGSNRKVTEGAGQVQKGSNKGGSQVKKRKANTKKTVHNDGDHEEDEEEDDGAINCSAFVPDVLGLILITEF